MYPHVHRFRTLGNFAYYLISDVCACDRMKDRQAHREPLFGQNQVLFKRFAWEMKLDDLIQSFFLGGGGVFVFVFIRPFAYFVVCLFLLLLRSQLYLWGSPFLVRFLRMWPFFFNPTIEVITFRLCGWCMLGVFLLPIFTRLWHECHDLLSLCDGMYVCTD